MTSPPIVQIYENWSFLAAFLIAVVSACAGPAPPSVDAYVDTAAAVDAPVTPAGCAPPNPAVVAGKFAAPDLTELSGLVASLAQPAVLWTHNDSDSQPRLFAVDTQAQLRAVVLVLGASVTDWEDIAIGPAADATGSYLYIGDIGDNQQQRSRVHVWRVKEPTLPNSTAAVVLTSDPAGKLVFDYPDGNHDAEALACDPPTGDLWLATKVKDGKTKVYRAAAPFSVGAIQVLQKVTALQWPGDPAVTGAAVAADGSLFILRTKTAARAWRRPASAGIAEALLGEPCPLPVPSAPQGEGIAWTSQGYFTVGEAAGGDLGFVGW